MKNTRDIKLNLRYAPMVAAVLGLIIMVAVHHQLAFNLNSFMLDDDGDGLKNYFNILYHIKHGTSYTQFAGFNYPYGEVIPYTDCMPLLANSLQWFCNHVVDISDYSVGFINASLLLSVPIAIFFIALIGQKMKMEAPLNIPLSIGVALLSGQTVLWTFGHYGLSFVWFFPLYFYLLLKFNEGLSQTNFKLWRYTIAIVLVIISVAYLHNYLALILLAFHLVHVVVGTFVHTSSAKLKFGLHGLLQLIIPVVVIYGVALALDDRTGRITMPFLLDHRLTLKDFLIPALGPEKDWFYAILGTINNGSTWYKVRTFLGFSTILAAIYSAFQLCYIVLKRQYDFTTVKNKILLYGIPASALLLFAMGIPLKFFHLYEYLPKDLRQIVALARFSWPFYTLFIIGVFAVMNSMSCIKLSRIIVMTLVLGLASEGVLYQIAISNLIELNERNFSASELKMIENQTTDYSKYQAIIAMPFYYKDISLHEFKGIHEIEKYSMQLSHKSGLPLVNAFLSRPSITESNNILGLFTPKGFSKPIKSDIGDQPFLIIQPVGDSISFSNMLNCFELDTLGASSKWLWIEGCFQSEHCKYLFDMGKPEVTVNEAWFYNDFNNNKTKLKKAGSGAAKLFKPTENVLFNSEVITDSFLSLNISFWYYSHLYDQSFNMAWVEIFDSSDQLLVKHYFPTHSSNLIDGDWRLNEMDVLIEEGQRFNLKTWGQNRFSDTFYIDELLIRDNLDSLNYATFDTDSVKGKLMINNYPI